MNEAKLSQVKEPPVIIRKYTVKNRSLEAQNKGRYRRGKKKD
jgi:hypothetical protein